MRVRDPLLVALFLLVASCSGDSTTDDDTGTTRDGGVVRDSGIVEGGACERFVVFYDLAGSQLEVRGVPGGNRTQDIGPGMMTIAYSVEGEARAEGPATILAHELVLDFEESGVVTDIETYAGPDECGLSTGMVTGSTLAWSSNLADHHARGSVTCVADEFFCELIGLPKDMPQSRDQDQDFPLVAFTLTSTGFTSDFVQIDDGGNIGDTFIKLMGSETSSACVPLPSGC
ncbi:MAG: hypothetical protein RMA76_39575 [Deltaproteobacteria bacterium]|jgi:hypothetical protein